MNTAAVVQKLGRYYILAEIASGGMATVYRGKLMGVEGFEKQVAIKRILPQWTDQQEFVDMLIDEAKILVHLQHNNIVQIFELCKERDSYFIVMEYVTGLDLKRLLHRLKQNNQTMPWHLACFIFKQIAAGLEFAHRRKNLKGEPLGIIHRDVSPQNILISHEGEVKITDFGIAKIRGKTAQTACGSLKGKFSYMSPEQASGKNVDERSDVFALAVLFFEMLAGYKCFTGSHDLEILERVKRSDYQLPLEWPMALKVIFNRALNEELLERYQSVKEMREDLDAFEKEAGYQASNLDLKEIMSGVLENEVIENTLPLPQKLIESSDSTSMTRVMTNLPDAQVTLVDQKTILTIAKTPPPESVINSVRSKKIHLSHYRRILLGAISLCMIFMGSIFYLKAKPQNLKIEKAVNPTIAYVMPDRLAQHEAFGPTEALKYEGIPKQRQRFIDQLQASLKIKTEPEDALIETKLDSKLISQSGSFEQTRPYALGSVSKLPFQIKHANYEDKELMVQIDEKKLIIDQTVALEAHKFGAVKVYVRPWGTATIKGLEPQVTPASFKVPVGRQLVSVYNPIKRKSVSQHVNVHEGHLIKCQATFGNKAEYMVCR